MENALGYINIFICGLEDHFEPSITRRHAMRAMCSNRCFREQVMHYLCLLTFAVRTRSGRTF